MRLLIFLLLGLFCAATGYSTPRLAATYGQDCHLCHVNPTGGGMRNSFVTQFIGPTELTLKPLSAHERARWPNPKITDQISIGADFRLLYLGTDNVSTEAKGFLKNTFFQMQGDIYLAFEPDPQFTLYFDRGLLGGYEAFILARILPEHGYLKAGQFVPDIGWRWDDHNHYTREKLDLDFPGAAEAGVEVGVRPGRLVLSAGVFNGAGGGFADIDNNSQKAVVGRALYRFRIGGIQAALGGSTRWNHGSAFRERLWGAQAQASWGPFAYIGDFYGRRMEALEGDTRRKWSWLFTQELDLLAIRGLDIYVAYDFLDPDLDQKSGTQTQVTFGCRIYVRHFLKIEPLFRYEEGEETAPGRRTNSRMEIILHGFY